MRRFNLLDFYSLIDTNGSCWNWLGRINKAGYPKLSHNRLFTTTFAHRISYELTIGDLIKGMDIDHLCSNRQCVNPKHLEQVTHKENVLRSTHWSAVNAKKTHCKQGHEFNESNTYIRPSGARDCKTCVNNSHRKSYARKQSS